MKTPLHFTRPMLPIAYLELLLEIFRARGLAPAQLLSVLPPPLRTAPPEARLSALQWSQLVARALEISADPALGYEYGMRMRPTAHGIVGYATMTATSLRQALAISVRYARVRQSWFELAVDDQDDHCRVVLSEKYPVPMLRSFFVENILLGLARGYAVLLGREATEVPGIEVWFDWPEPAYHAAWSGRLPPVRFDQPVCAIRVDAKCLALCPVLADPHASRQAIALCERELALVPADDAGCTAQVRARLVTRPGGGYPSLAEVAAELALSTRTLKRRLQGEGSSFLFLLDESRRRDAREWLERTELPVQRIATRLGYRNPANFTRAFQAWTGASPTAWRARQRAQDGADLAVRPPENPPR